MSAFNNNVYIPSLLWYQYGKKIIIDIKIMNYSKPNICICDNNINFSCMSNEKLYNIEFELFKSICNNNIQYNENNIKIILEKEEEEEWIQLTKVKNLYKNNIKINWSYWKTEDDEDENTSSNFDMSQMMQGMNGGGFNMEEMMKNMNQGNFENTGDNEEYNENEEESNEEESNEEESNEEESNEKESNEEESNEEECNEDEECNEEKLNEELNEAFNNNSSEECISCSH